MRGRMRVLGEMDIVKIGRGYCLRGRQWMDKIERSRLGGGEKLEPAARLTKLDRPLRRTKGAIPTKPKLILGIWILENLSQILFQGLFLLYRGDCSKSYSGKCFEGYFLQSSRMQDYSRGLL